MLAFAYDEADDAGAGNSNQLFLQWPCARQAWRWAAWLTDASGYPADIHAWDSFVYALQNSDPWIEWSWVGGQNALLFYNAEYARYPGILTYWLVQMFGPTGNGGHDGCSYLSWWMVVEDRPTAMVLRGIQAAIARYPGWLNTLKNWFPDYGETALSGWALAHAVQNSLPGWLEYQLDYLVGGSIGDRPSPYDAPQDGLAGGGVCPDA